VGVSKLWARWACSRRIEKRRDALRFPALRAASPKSELHTEVGPSMVSASEIPIEFRKYDKPNKWIAFFQID